jgi:hypothetical protein
MRNTTLHFSKILDLFNNPVGYRTSPGKMLRILLFLSGCCLKTEVFKQLSCSIFAREGQENGGTAFYGTKS